MRLLYSLAWWLALPAVLLRLWHRGRKEPGYRRHLRERFGFYPELPVERRGKPLFWVHAVSVGETRAAQPLIEALLSDYTDATILLTHMTATGRETGSTLFARHGSRVLQSYLPYDIGLMARRFLQHYRPRICVLMETEVWPTMIAQCVRNQVPVALVNARLSERSLRKAKRFSALMTEAVRRLTCIAAQTEADAMRLRELGAINVRVTGNIKFDVTPPEALLEKGYALRSQVGGRPVLLCASTRDGEETLILDALHRIAVDDLLLVLVPRHPQRFDEVAGMLAQRGLAMCRRSTLNGAPLPGDVRILLGDSMGEMFAYYAMSDVAFIGGSLLPLGGQNLIEACAVGKPVLIGPHTFNFGSISEDAINAGAALRVFGEDQMLSESMRLLNDHDSREAMSRNAREFALRHRGATFRTVALLHTLIERV
jgi:3-deoxy-D-manno-octulosonic-acid transferase